MTPGPVLGPAALVRIDCNSEKFIEVSSLFWKTIFALVNYEWEMLFNRIQTYLEPRFEPRALLVKTLCSIS